jgi:hypothetical protein
MPKQRMTKQRRKAKGVAKVRRLNLNLHPETNQRHALIAHLLDRMGIPTSQATYEVLLEWALDTARLIAKEKYRLDDMTIKHMSPGDLLRVITDDYVPPIATVKVVRETTVIPQIPTERGQENETHNDMGDGHDFGIYSI